MANKKDTQKPLKKLKANFNLVGKVKVNDYTFNLDNTYDSSKWTDNTMNLGVDCGNGNVVYCEMRGGYSKDPSRDNVLYVHGVKEDENGHKQSDFDNRFTIDWEDRFDTDILATVGEMCFVNIGVEKDDKGKTFSKKFVSAYDAVEYLNEHLEDGMVVNIKGNLEYGYYQDSTTIKKTVTSIFLSKAEEDDYKAKFTQTILIDANSIGKLDNEKGTMGLQTFVVDYVGKVDGKEIKKTVALPKAFEIAVNADKPELTQKMLKSFFKVDKKNNALSEITVEGDIVEGQAIVNITDEDIPDDIKELIEMGLFTEEEAKTKCAVGNTSRERRLIIQRPAISYVGEGEERKPIVAITKDKYKESDLVLIGRLVAELNNKEDDSSEKVDSSTEDIDDDDELMKMLNDLDD